MATLLPLDPRGTLPSGIGPQPPGVRRRAREQRPRRDPGLVSRQRDAFDVAEYDHEELIDAGNQVVQFFRIRARGRASGIVLEGSLARSARSEGLVVRVEFFDDRTEALEATGLSK